MRLPPTSPYRPTVAATLPPARGEAARQPEAAHAAVCVPQPSCATRLRPLRRLYRRALSAGGGTPQDVAQRLGLPEGLLVAAHALACPGERPALTVRRLAPVWPAIVDALPAIGGMALRHRRSEVVLELQAAAGAVTAAVPWLHWAYGYAVVEPAATPRGSPRRSLRFYDRHGEAVHVFDLGADSVVPAFLDLIERWGSTLLPPTGLCRSHARRRDARGAAGAASIGAAADCEPPPDPLTTVLPVDPACAHELLHRALQAGLALSLAPGGGGTPLAMPCTDPAPELRLQGDTLQLDAPGWRLRWRERHVRSAQLVQRPTRAGLRQHLQLCSADGEPFLDISAALPPGRPEPCAWRELVAALLPRPPAPR